MLQNHPLNELNTLKVNCTAKLFTEVKSSYQLLQLIQTPERINEKHRILGGGANTLFVSDFFDGLVVKIAIPGIKIIKEENNQVRVQVGAGEKREHLIAFAQSHQLGGIENLIAIPWNVGTSAVSNIGAYGQEVSEVIEEVQGLNLKTQSIQKLSNTECQFAYRESIFKHELNGQFIITHITFRLQKVDENYHFSTAYGDIQNFLIEKGIAFEKLSPYEKLTKISEIISETRTSKLPDIHTTWTAGSFFKNPEIWLVERKQLQSRFPQLKAHLGEHETMKLSAAQLIELCGWKGKTINSVKMSENHALILINEGNSWKAIAEYADQVRVSVLEKFGIELEPEVRYCE